jgi:hypothetical protein
MATNVRMPKRASAFERGLKELFDALPVGGGERRGGEWARFR